MSRFHIYRIHTEGSEIAVDGRCVAGSLRLHATFVILARSDNSGNLSEPRRVALQVLRILAYEHEFDIIDEGLTARVFLCGEGSEYLEHDLVLSTDG